jgi:hypothetical protein
MAIDKNNLLFDCKLFGTGKRTIEHKACVDCKNKFNAQFKACVEAVQTAKKAKKNSQPKVTKAKGFWGYAQGSYTDIFCNAICEKPLTMNQAAAIIAPDGQPIGPHSKCKARLISENLAVFENHQIYMRVWPKGHSLQGQLTPAAKIARSSKAVDKKAA